MKPRLEGHTPTVDEALAFERYKLSPQARKIALYAARRNPITAAACYAAIRASCEPHYATQPI